MTSLYNVMRQHLDYIHDVIFYCSSIFSPSLDVNRPQERRGGGGGSIFQSEVN